MQQPVMRRSPPAVADRLLLLALSTLWGASYTFMALLGESLSASAWVGLGCVVAGVAARTLPSRKRG
ncbi:hypothetical protein LGN17_29190 [Burkholderia sp. AU30280]|nr:hypothetical protein [Burkholderia sp. AU30280]